MKEIKYLVEEIKEELEGAEEYAKHAFQYMWDDRTLSETLAAIATQELSHVDALHAQAVRLIKASTDKPPASMQAVWDWEHERMVEKTAKIKLLLASAKR